MFRQHSAAQGRWLVPDPAGLAAADLSNPQTWNRYAYVANNPLNNVDPLGLCGTTGTSWDSSTNTLTGDEPCPLLPLDGPGYGNIPVHQIDQSNGGYTFTKTVWGRPINSNVGTQSSDQTKMIPLISGPSSSPGCDDLAQQIVNLRDEIAGRFSAYNNPTYNLPLFGPNSRMGHIQQITNKQQNLRNLLNEFITQGCGSGALPSDAWGWATVQAPTLTPSPSGLPPWMKAVGAGAAVGLGICDILVPEVCLPITGALGFAF